MPRNRPKKGKSYSENDLEKAIKEVERCRENNLPYSQRDIARQFNLNKDVLNRRLRGLHTSVAGRPTAIPQEEEAELATLLKTMSKWGFGLLKEEIKDVVQEFVTQHAIKSPFKDNRPGDDWFLAFKERHNLTVKKPESLEIARRNVTSDPFIVYEFYNLLDKEIKRLELENLPSQIYNLDESGFQMDPSKCKVVTEKGKPAHRIIQGSGRENTTVLACVNAEGKVLPPLVLYEANKLWSSWIGSENEGMIKGTFFGVSPTGWMTANVFHQWFVEFTKLVKERPILLLFDGHLSHLDVKTIETARSNNITILKLPPHSTDLLQPLDRCVFGPLKIAWDVEIHKFQRQNQSKLTKADFVNILGRVWHIGLSEKNIVAGFTKTGIFPTNPEKYPKHRLDPVKLNKYNKKLEAQNQLQVFNHPEQEMNSDEENLDETELDGSKTVQLEKEVGEIEQSISADFLNIDQPSTSAAGIPPVSLSSQTPATSAEQVVARPSTSFETVTPKRSFENLLLERVSPKGREKPKKKRMKIDVGAAVITSETYFKSIAEEENKRKQKEEEKEKRKTERARNKEEKEKRKKEKAGKSKMVKKPKVANSSSEDDVPEVDLCQEMSDGSLHLSDTSDDELPENPKESFKIPSNARQIKLHIQKVRENITEMQMFAVYFENTFYIGQVQKLFYSCEKEVPENLCNVEMKFLKWCGDDKYDWKTNNELEIINSDYIFYGPINTVSFSPFIVRNVSEIRTLYAHVKRLRDDVFNKDIQ